MQWAAEGHGNHNPKVVVKAPSVAERGATIRLDASKSDDPDGDGLTFLWWQQPEIGTTKVAIDQSDQPIATIHIPSDAAGDTIHIICEVHDNGPFHLVAYRRIIIHIQ